MRLLPTSIPSPPRLQQSSNPAPFITPPLVTSAKTVRGRRNAFWPHIQVPVGWFIPPFSQPTSYIWDGTGVVLSHLKQNKNEKYKKLSNLANKNTKNKQQGKAQGPNTRLSNGKAFPLPQLHNARLATGFGTDTRSFWRIWQVTVIANAPSSPDQTMWIDVQYKPSTGCALVSGHVFINAVYLNVHQIYLSCRIAHHLFTSYESICCIEDIHDCTATVIMKAHFREWPGATLCRVGFVGSLCFC